MLHLLTTLLLLACTLADPQQGGYDYLPPSIPFGPIEKCLDVTSVVYSTSVRQSFIPSTVRQVNTQYITTTVYSQQVIPTTQYRTQYQTKVNYQTSYVQRQTQVQREEVFTSTQFAKPVFETTYVTSTRIVPQVSYVVREQVQTQVVPVERINTRYQTKYEDQVQYQTIPVQRTEYATVRGRDVVSTYYSTQIQSSVVQRPQPAQTIYATTTLIDNQVDVQTVPSPPVVSTRIVQSQRVIPTTLVNTQIQTKYVTQTQHEIQTQYHTRSQIQTQRVPQEVVITVDVPREVVSTQYRTQVVPTTNVQIRHETQVRQVAPVYRTQQEYQTSIVRIPGQDRIEKQEIVSTQYQQQIVYKTQNVNRDVTVTRTVEVPCGQTGYNYQEPQIQFKF